jgi:hypothetical protein
VVAKDPTRMATWILTVRIFASLAALPDDIGDKRSPLGRKIKWIGSL